MSNKENRNNKRICYVNPTKLIKRPISEISSRMNDFGYYTSILVPKRLFKKYDDSLHHTRLLGDSSIETYSTINFPFIKNEQPIPVTLKFPFSVFKVLKNNDIIHMWVPYYFTNLKIIAIKKFFYPNTKLILTMDTVPGYSFSMGKGMDNLFKIYDKIFGWLIFKTSDVITLYGESLVPYALKAGIPKEKIRVLSTGIELKKINKKIINNIKKSVKKEFGISEHTKIVLFAGLMVQRKGIEKIINIANILKKENVVFLLAGDGPEKERYIAYAKKLGLSDKMFFLGWRKDMQRLYQASDILLLPAEGEGLPGVVMEAMSYGVPCVASNIPCIPDLIKDGTNGYLCDKDNPEEFARKIKLLIHNDSLHKKISKNALLDIRKFDWGIIIKKYNELYRGLI